MIVRAAACAALLAVLVNVPVRAQTVSRELLLARVARWVQQFVRDLSNVVAEEAYRQEFQFAPGRRRLKSDFLLVRYPGEQTVWVAFRDVLEVNGRRVRDQQDRLTKLFMEPFADALRRAEEITRDASRHSLVELGPDRSPLAVIALLQPQYQQDFNITLGGVDRKLGPNVRALELEGRPVPSAAAPGVRQEPLRAIAWVEEDTGRVVKTELRAGVAPNTSLTTTTFRIDEALGITVPAEMRDSRILPPIGTRARFGATTMDQFLGVATYSRFRRFEVRTEESILPEATGR